MKATHGHEFFLKMEKRLREAYERRQCKAATQLLLWLTSKPWAFIEREHFALAWRAETFGHFFVCVMSNGLSRACDTDIGRNYLNALIEACEEKPDNDAVPNASTAQQYIIRDKPPQSGHDHAKTVIKAGKAPYDLWSKFVTLYGAKNKAFLKAMLAKQSFDPAVIAKIEKLLEGHLEEKKVFSLAVFTMAKRLNRSYGFRMVEADITQVFAPEGKKAAVIFASNPQGDGIDRTFSLVFETPDDLDDQIEQARKDAGLVKPEPPGFRKLTFDHVSTVMGFVNIYFSARDLYLSVKKENAVDTTKSAFKLLSSMYTMPWVQERLASKMQDFSVSFLAKETNEWIAKRGIPIVAFAIQAITVAFAAEDLWKKAHDGTTEDVVGSALYLAGEIVILISMGMVVASGGVLTPAAGVVALIGLALSISSFVYTQFIPTDHERALLDCLFGKDFPRDATGRPWQACPSKQLRAYNHVGKSGEQELDAYRRQISAFSNLMHNFNLQVTLSDTITDRAATIVIKPSAVPRAAYFDVRLVMTWWVTGENDDVTWTGECRFMYFPYRDNVPPLSPPAKDNLSYNAMNDAGVVVPSGGAFQIFSPLAGANPIELAVSPRIGEPATWTGKLENIAGGVKKPLRVAARYNEDYRIRSQVSLDGKELRVELEFLPGTTEDMSVAELEVTVAFQRFIENQPFGVPEQETFNPERSVQGNQNQRETIRFIVPIESDNLAERRVAGFRIGMVYRDDRLGEPRIRPKQTESQSPGVPSRVKSEIIKDKTETELDFELEYRARLVHTGDAAVFDFEATGSTLSDPNNAFNFRNDVIVLDKVVVQYVGNPQPDGTSTYGSFAKPEFNQLSPLGFPPDGSTFRTKIFAGPIMPFDELAVRFTANVEDENGNEVWTEGPFETGLVAGIGWEFTHEEQRTAVGGRIKSAECHVTMVLDGDPTTRKFMPNNTVGFDPAAEPLTVKARFLDIERGVELGAESEEAAAIDACKS